MFVHHACVERRYDVHVMDDHTVGSWPSVLYVLEGRVYETTLVKAIVHVRLLDNEKAVGELVPH